MRLFPVVVKRAAAAVAAGAANVLTQLRAGVSLSTVVGLSPSSTPVTVGLTVTPRTQAVTATNAGLNIAASATGTAASPPVTPGLSLSSLVRLAPATNSAARITRIQFNLTHARGGSSVVSNTGWTNPANAIDGPDGKANGTFATVAGGGTGANGTIILGYPAQPNRTALIISQVTLRYVTSRNDLLSSYAPAYSLDGGASFTALPAGQVGEFTADITAAVGGDWSKLAALQARVLANVASLATVSLDAIELTVTAAHTMTP